MTEDPNETADTISYMKAEISAALEGIEEATYLRGILGEMLLCGKEALQQGERKMIGKAQDHGPIKPLTIALHDEGQERILPLGLHPTTPAISKTRIAAGGEVVERTARDIGRLKSRMVGKYSFERIVI